MKKSLLSAILFATAFIVTYISLCYLIPGLRIKLDAEPAAYFVESLKNMILFKGIISFVAGLIAGAIPVIVGKEKSNCTVK